MNRITITMEDDLLEEIDAMVGEHGYQNRSEVIRDLARSGLVQKSEEMGSKSGACVGALIYVYDHAARHLSQRLVESAHHHHDVAVATMHVHLDDDSCLEVTALKGSRDDIQHFTDHVIAERGVRYGRAVIIPTNFKTAPAKPHRHR